MPMRRWTHMISRSGATWSLLHAPAPGGGAPGQEAEPHCLQLHCGEGGGDPTDGCKINLKTCVRDQSVVP